jgi:hypothetical protein
VHAATDRVDPGRWRSGLSSGAMSPSTPTGPASDPGPVVRAGSWGVAAAVGVAAPQPARNTPAGRLTCANVPVSRLRQASAPAPKRPVGALADRDQPRRDTGRRLA